MRALKVIEDVLVIGDEQVVRNLFYPQVLGRNGLPILSGLLGPGGAKSGYTLGERLRIMQDQGIGPERFKVALGTSAGAYNLLGYAAGQAHLIPAIYKKISWLNPEVLYRALFLKDYLGLQYLEEMVRATIDIEMLKKCSMDLTIGVSDMQGNPVLHKVQDFLNPNPDAPSLTEDPVSLAAASSALFPIVPGKMIRGIYSVDGGYTVKSGVVEWTRRLLHKVPPRQEIDLLFIANRPHPRHEDPVEEMIFRFMAKIALRKHPDLLRGLLSVSTKLKKLADRFEKREERQGHQRRRIRMCALYPLPDENIYPHEWQHRIFDRRGGLTRSRTDRFLKAMKPQTWV